jgi:hypothetical protein
MCCASHTWVQSPWNDRCPIHMLAHVCYSHQSPPDVCFQIKNIFMSLLIHGHLGNKMGVYMEPLIDELVHTWEEGVWRYD